jgi:3-oxoacyl-[acyl-carrier protein] reductase
MNVFITGVSRGIGKELVKQFMDAGVSQIFAVSRSASQLAEDSYFVNDKVHFIDFDFLTGNYQSLINVISSKTETIDIIINNAGYLVNKPFEQISSQDLQQIYEVNVFAPFKIIQSLLPFLRKAGKAHIVNISSMGGVHGSSKFAGLSAYSSSKAAVASLSECLAEEFKNESISVNALAIGAVQTEMLAEAFPGYQAPLLPAEMAAYIYKFAIEGHKFFNGKVISVSSSTP